MYFSFIIETKNVGGQIGAMKFELDKVQFPTVDNPIIILTINIY